MSHSHVLPAIGSDSVVEGMHEKHTLKGELAKLNESYLHLFFLDM